jgi:hypothetical protein
MVVTAQWVAGKLIERIWLPHTRSCLCGFRVTFAAAK